MLQILIRLLTVKEAVAVVQTAIDNSIAGDGITDAKAATEKMKWIPKY